MLLKLRGRQFGRNAVNDEERRWVSEARDDEQRDIAVSEIHDETCSQLEQNAAYRAHHATDADDTGYRGFGKHIGRQREEVRRPSLVSAVAIPSNATTSHR